MNDKELINQFERCTLPFDQWTHRAHVKVAYLYLSSHSFDEAVDKMRAGVKAYNSANDVPEGPMMGYNETTTVAFLYLIAATIKAYNDYFPAANADAFCDNHPQLMCKHVLRLFYSPECRMHPEAKTSFIEPDLAPLPVI